jgi:tetraacyldisaccharide 4'-kinase
VRTSPHDFWVSVISGEARGPLARAAAAALRLVSAGYGMALRVHLAGYRLGLAKGLRLPAVVVSVGNLTVGGTGKTTAAESVARWLWERGRRVALLSRGYRGSGERDAVIVSEGFGPLVDVATAGDEPYMLAQALPSVAVLVGKDRRLTGRLAVERLGADALVLDDGFQYHRLAKDIEIVLVDALAPFGYDFLVPRGMLREPLGHLARADGVWLTHCDLVRRDDLAAICARVQEVAPQARVWQTMHVPVRLRGANGDVVDPGAVYGRRICALSSIGNPPAFERTLERLGADLVAKVRFPDHHRYRADELHEIAAARAADAEWIVTTRKDAVRLPPEATEKPVWVLEVELAELLGEPTLSEELGCLVRAKDKM